GYVVRVFNNEQLAGRLLGQAARHLLVDEVNDLLAYGRLAYGGGRVSWLFVRRGCQYVVRHSLLLVAAVQHGLAGGLDDARVFGIQEEDGGGGAGVERFLAHAAQQRTHFHRDIAKVDVYRTGVVAFVADGAVIGDVFEFFPVLEADAAPCLFFVQKGFDQQGRSKDFVARRVQQVGAWHVSGAYRLALAAAQAVFDGVGDRADFAALHDQGFMPQQVEAGRPGMTQVSAGQEFASVETA